MANLCQVDEPGNLPSLRCSHRQLGVRKCDGLRCWRDQRQGKQHRTVEAIVRPSLGSFDQGCGRADAADLADHIHNLESVTIFGVRRSQCAMQLQQRRFAHDDEPLHGATGVAAVG